MSRIPTQTHHKGDLQKLAWCVKSFVLIFAAEFILKRVWQLMPVYYLKEPQDFTDILAVSLHVPHYWSAVLPLMAYLSALWAAGNMLAKLDLVPAYGLSQKSDDGMENLRQFLCNFGLGLQHIGMNLMFAGLATILLAPSVEFWLSHQPAGLRMKLQWELVPACIGMIGVILKIAGLNLAKIPLKT